MSLERFEVISTISNTLQDSLKLVKLKEDGQLYTIKSVRVDENSEKEKELFFNELRILVPLTHKNIIMYKEAFYDKETKTLNMVIEYIDGGDLSMRIQLAQRKKKFFQEKIIWRIFIQILEGVNYLHNKFIIHRDLKTSNIYLSKKGRVKIGGLNVGKNIEDIGMALTQIGTPYFTAPEIWEQKPYDYKCDIWSIGCILYEMTCLHVPFLGLNMEELYKNIKNLKYKPIPKIYSKDLNEIIKLTLKKNPIDRPSTKELLKNGIILNKMKELDIINDNRDEFSYINKTVKKIIDDYNNKIKKLDNSHIIYKKIDKNPVERNSLKEKPIKNSQIYLYNNNDKKINMVNNMTNSEHNKIFYMNKKEKDIRKNKIIKNNTSCNLSDENLNSRGNTQSNLRKDYNYSCSVINQKITPSIFNNSARNIEDGIKNKRIPIKIVNKNNFSQKNKIKKNTYFINIPKNHDLIRINPENILNKNNENAYQQYILNKKIENQPNKFIQIHRNVYNHNNNSNNHYNIKINYNNYKQKNIQNNTIFNLNKSSNIISKGKSPNNKYKLNSKIEKNLTNYNEENVNGKNCSKYLINNSNLFLKSSNSPENLKKINYNINNINYQIDNKNFSKYYATNNTNKNQIIIDKYKNKSDNNNIRQFNKILKRISPDKINEITKKNNYLINNKRDLNKRCFPKKIDINLKNGVIRDFESPLLKRNIYNFSKKNENTYITNRIDRDNIIKNKVYINNYFSEKKIDNFKENNNNESNKYYFLSDSSQNYGL